MQNISAQQKNKSVQELDSLVIKLTEEKKYKEAFEVNKDQLSILEESGDTLGKEYSLALSNYANCQNYLNNKAIAKSAYWRVVNHGKRNNLAEENIQNAWRGYAFFPFFNNDQEEGIRILEEGVDWAKSNGLEDTETYISNIFSLMLMNSRMYNHLRAEKLAIYRLELIESNIDKYKKDYAQALKDYGTMLKNNRAYENADTVFNLAIEFAEKIGDKDAIVEAQIAQAQNHMHLGNYNDAIDLYESIVIYMEDWVTNKTFKEIHLMLGASMYSEIGNLEEAYKINKRARTYFEHKGIPIRYRGAILGYAIILAADQKHEEALEQFLILEEMTKKIFPNSKRRLAGVHIKVAETQLALARYDEALLQLNKVISTDTTAFDYTAFKGYSIAFEAAMAKKNFSLAKKIFTHLDAIANSDMYLSFTDRINLLLFEANLNNHEGSYADAYTNIKEASDIFFSTIEREFDFFTESDKLLFKTKTNKIIYQFRKLLVAENYDKKLSIPLLNNINLTYKDLSSSNKDSKSQYVDILGVTQFERYLRFKKLYAKEILSNSPKGARIAIYQDSIDKWENTVQRKLQSSNILTFDDIINQYDSNTSLLYFFTTGKESNDNLYCTINTNKKSTLLKINAPYTAQNVWKQIESTISTKNLIISKAHPIKDINFHAIPTDNGHVADDFTVSHFNRSNYVKSQKSPSIDFVSMVGDIIYEHNSIAVADVRSDFGNLVFTAKELEALKEMIPANQYVSFEKDEALPDEISDMLGDQRNTIIHMGTHGYVSDTQSKEIHSLLYNGLVLSGDAYEDRLLSAFEINNISMENLKLVTLSACNSAQGTFIPEDGVFGLQKAFLNGGVKNLLVATSEISDLHTYLFMEHFYQNLLQNDMTIREAYSESILWSRDKFKSDTWKHFVLYGNGYEKVRVTPRNYTFPIILGLTVIIGLFAWKKRTTLKAA